MRHNILITSAGRRAKLVTIFQRELAELIPGGRLFAADMRPEVSVACHLADRSFVLPPIEDPTHIQQLLAVCTENNVGLVVPTADPELPVLASRRNMFSDAGIAIAVSDAEFVRICRDKRQTASWFAERRLRTPRIFSPQDAADFPLFAKPFDGSGSQSTRVIHTAGELAATLEAEPRTMLLEYLPPVDHDEYSLDMYYGRDSMLRCCVPRLRIETRAGEVSKARTCGTAALDPLRNALGRIVGARGCLTVQVFVQRQTSDVCGIEINPRFGGGYPLSYEAGANFPQWLIREYMLGESVEKFDDWEHNLTMLRYDEHVVVRGAAA